MQKVVTELGLEGEIVDKLGLEWKVLCEAWLAAEAALTKVGGKASAIDLRIVPVPQSLINWCKYRGKHSTSFVSIGDQMTEWWTQLSPQLEPLVADDLIRFDWCCGGLSGICLLLLGMKEWGLVVKSSKKRIWKKIVEDLTKVFQIIPSATIL